jgi:CheY-like chemotaxis protein
MSTPRAKQGEETRRKEPGPTTTILVVEDFDETRSMLRLSMELSGYRVVEAINGQQAVEVARRERPDVILMDIGLPVMDGCKATRLIREDKALRNVAIVAVSANATAEYRVKALAAGCDEYVTKPIDFDHLKTLIADFVWRSDSAEYDRLTLTRQHSNN